MKILIACVVVVVTTFALATWWALESSGVAVITTRASDGFPRQTHIWFAESDGELWIEAGSPANPWYQDVQRQAAVSFSSPRRSGRFVARPVQSAGARARVRSLIRDKYGARDWWIGVLFDTDESVAVELAPPASPAPEAG